MKNILTNNLRKNGGGGIDCRNFKTPIVIYFR